MKKKLLTGILSVILLSTSMLAPSADTQDVSNTLADSINGVSAYSVVAENQNLSLLIDRETTEFKVVNKNSNYYWSSSLSNEELDGEDRSFAYVTKSLLIINYLDQENDNEDYVGSYIDSVESGNFKIKTIKNGVQIDFYFSFLDLTVPLVLTLQEDSLNATVLTDKIKYNTNKIRIQSISVLPYFGAAENNISGYAFVPDGSGGLVYFDRVRSEQSSYEKPVYGADISSEPNESSDISLPVFGMCHNENSFLAVISEDAADAYINCNGYKDKTPYTNIFAKFQTATKVQFELIEQNKMVVYEKGGIKTKKISVDYFFMSGKESNYVGLAQKLKSMTFGDNYTNKEALVPALYTDLYASVKKIRSVWGLKFNYNCVLTDMQDVDNIFSELQQNGVNSIVARYNNFDKKDVNNKILNRFSWNNSLGRKPLTYSEKWSEKGIDFYYGYENTQTYSKSANPFHTLSMAARDPSDSLTILKVLKNSNISESNTTNKKTYALNFKQFNKSFNSLIKSLRKQKIQKVAFSDLGTLLYSDFRYETKKRYEFTSLISKTLSDFVKDGNSLMLKNPNYYAGIYANEIIALPLKSSGHDLIDQDVPFLQLFYNGIIRYSSEPVNLSADSYELFLKCLETGSMPTFSWIGKDSSLLTNTELEYMFSANYKDWIDTAVNQYSIIKEISDKNEHTAIKEHRKLQDGIFACIYENGAAVVVNYNKQDMHLEDGTTIKANDYAIVKEGQLQ